MAVDLSALAQAAAGDPNAKVAVKKRWLAAVHHELTEAQSLKLEVTRLRRGRKLGDGLAGLGERLLRLQS